VPRVASLEAFHRAVGEFVVEDLGLVIEPAALAAAGRSLDSGGLLLLGEVHGVRENPLVIRSVMRAFGPGGCWPAPQTTVRLHEDNGQFVLDLPMAMEAVVPQRPQSSSPPATRETC
jgi:hypothetical protein